jgi:hypothetical protein
MSNSVVDCRFAGNLQLTITFFSFLDLVFQAALKRRNVVELTSGEWAINKDNMRAEDGKCY